MDARRRRGRRKERTDKKPQDQKPLFFSKSAAARRGMRWRAAYLRSACGAHDAQSNKLVEDSAGRLRPTAAARMNGNSLLSKLDKRCGQEAGCSGAPARRRPGGRHGRRSTALTHEALACAVERGACRDAVARENARKSRKIRYFSPVAPPPGPPGQDPFMDVPPRRGRRGCCPPELLM